MRTLEPALTTKDGRGLMFLLGEELNVVGLRISGTLGYKVWLTWFFLLVTAGLAQIPVDKTCATCGRQQLDSLNLKPRNIRVNQVGYLPQDPRKRAFAANAQATTFNVVDADTKKSVYSGSLQSLGSLTEGAMHTVGFYNSINPLYTLDRAAVTEPLSSIDFSAVTTPGRYVLAVGKDTSSTFVLDPKIYNQVFETTLKFFGAQRCGPTHSWFHQGCHLKDGSALGAKYTGALAGGWHDCGDHGKYSETVAYAAVVLAMTYAYWPQKAEDFYGASYNDTLPFGTDGIPDLLNEAKVGADYILKLYNVSVAEGLLAKGDMYHSVGTGPGEDHLYWDVPENQDAQPKSRGGPDRPVTKGIGSNVAGMYSAALAFFAWGWEPFNPTYAAQCLAASKDIYAKLVITRRNTTTTEPCCYDGAGRTDDDEALAAFALWFATKDKTYRHDLLEDPALGVNANAVYNQGWFPTGLLAVANKPFHHGGWTTDYQNTHIFTLYGLAKLVVSDPIKAAAYGISAVDADSIKKDCIAAMQLSIRDGSNGKDKTTIPGINFDPPYNGVFTSVDWGYNRYNFGLVLELFLYWDVTGDKNYYNLGIDNINYNLGANPWDISFIMGAGDKNLQHPHNRAANPEGYNAGGIPYEYKTPKGAFMGGCRPDKLLIDVWRDYVNTETCIDFSAQLVIPSQMLAMDLPEDKVGPKFRNVSVIPEDVRATVLWTTDEISRDTLYLYDSPGGKLLQTVSPDTLAKIKQLVLLNLTPKTTYYFKFKGMDIRRNSTEDNNGGAYYRFTTLATPPPSAQITGVKVCNETHEQAMVTWWTRNGLYNSRVDYGAASTAGKPALVQQPDDAGIPTAFHQVTLNGLTPATQYKYSVTSGATTDDSTGGYYHFGTTQVLVNYTIRIKPTGRVKEGKGAHFYIEISNNERKPYTGVELRFYFTADAALAQSMVPYGDDNNMYDVAGSGSGLALTYGKAIQVPGFTDQWYFPITMNSVLPVAGRARIEFEVDIGSRGATTTPFSTFTNAWSIRPHTAPPDPVAFSGIDLSKGEQNIFKTPEPVETVNGQAVVTFTNTKYITAYYQGVHVYGYGPDFVSDVLQKKRTASMTLSAPVVSPVDKLEVRQESKPIVVLGGKASVAPDGAIDEVWVNGAPLPASDRTQAADGSVGFSHALDIAEGTNYVDVVAFDTVHCVFAAEKIAVNWIKSPPPPPDTVQNVTATPASKTSRDPIVITLASATPGATIWYTLDGTLPQPGKAGTVEYKGGITVAKDSLTLKAQATKAGLIPSGVTTEKYAILPFRTVPVTQAWLRDRNADGYADMVVIRLDLRDGALNNAQALAQITAAKLTGGFVLDPAGLATALSADPAGLPIGLSGDSLSLPLVANTLPVVEGQVLLPIGLTATPQDGLLSPGSVTVHDGVAPVLRAAILHRHAPNLVGARDTLTLIVSEAVNLTTAIGKVLSGLDLAAPMTYALDLAPGVAVIRPNLSGTETAYDFLLASITSPTGAAVEPKAGDSVWINPLAGLADNAGMAQTNPSNRRVTLRIAVPLQINIGPTAEGGVSHVGIPNLNDPTWSTIASGSGPIGIVLDHGSVLTGIAVHNEPVDPTHFGGVAVDATVPFAVNVQVFSNLGQLVNQINVRIDESSFARLPTLPGGSRRLSLLWNGRTRDTQFAGTGAYIYVWNLTSTDSDGRPVSRSDRKIYGFLRGL